MVILDPPRLFAAIYGTPGGAHAPAICGLLIRREALQAIGGLQPEFTGMYEDQVLNVKAGLKLRAVIDPRPLSLYRQHPDSACAVALANGDWRRSAPSRTQAQFHAWARDYVGREAGVDSEEWQIVMRDIQHSLDGPDQFGPGTTRCVASTCAGAAEGADPSCASPGRATRTAGLRGRRVERTVPLGHDVVRQRHGDRAAPPSAGWWPMDRRHPRLGVRPARRVVAVRTRRRGGRSIRPRRGAVRDGGECVIGGVVRCDRSPAQRRRRRGGRRARAGLAARRRCSRRHETTRTPCDDSRSSASRGCRSLSRRSATTSRPAPWRTASSRAMSTASRSITTILTTR